jgi:nitrite reductase/ring-hydroxylating ferredoxin subunit
MTGLSDETLASLRSLIARRQPGYSLEAPFYTSPDVFAADMEIIFGRHWIYACVEPEVPEPGDYVTVSLGRNSVVILRDDDMGLRAYHNVCRHRGAKLVHEESGAVGNIVCRYHQWTYNLEGRLIYADHMGAEFDTSCFGLKPVHVRSVAGLVFICLAAEAPADIDAMDAAMTPYLAPHDLRNCKVAASNDLIERGNWKLTMENNRECYHCSGNHPELTIPLFAYGFGFAPGQMDEVELQQAARYEDLVVQSAARAPRRRRSSRHASPAAPRGKRAHRPPRHSIPAGGHPAPSLPLAAGRGARAPSPPQGTPTSGGAAGSQPSRQAPEIPAGELLHQHLGIGRIGSRLVGRRAGSRLRHLHQGRVLRIRGVPDAGEILDIVVDPFPRILVHQPLGTDQR